MGGKQHRFHQETQVEKSAARDDKEIGLDAQKKSITLKENGKGCAHDKDNNKQNSVAQKKDAFNDITSPYLLKIENRKRKLMILRKDSIDKYMVFKDGCMNENNSLTVKYIRPEENVKDFKMTHTEKE